MIIDKTIEIKVGTGSIKHFKNLGYNVKFFEHIIIPIKHTPKSSRVIITAKCEFCAAEKQLKFQSYQKSYSNYNIYLCNKCKYLKSKQTNLEKYGNLNYNNIEMCKKN